MKKVLVVDWLDKYGGAERVIRSICNIFMFEKCYTLTNIMAPLELNKTFAEQQIPIKETPLKYSGAGFRWFFILFPFFLRKIKIPRNIDMIISSSHAVAKGVKKSRNNQLHISYFQARNQKYIWEDSDLYFGRFSFLVRPLFHYLRKKDIEDAQKPDFIVSNSNFVKEWVKKNYNRDSLVIYPPVNLSIFPLKKQKKNYFVAVGRLEPYKRFDLVIKAFNKTGQKLIVVGDGSQIKKLKRIAKKNIEFVGFVNSQEVYQYISTARGFVHAGIEDFGIAPIEAQSCGTPVIAYGHGGVLETIIENRTGIFFREDTAESLIEALERFEKTTFDPIEVSRNAARFDKTNFEMGFKNFIDEKTNQRNKKLMTADNIL